RLLQMMFQRNVSDEMIVLGLLPRWEQVQLQRAADFIIQPSLFEGWSTVVEDAKTLGQRLVVSDIAVHREQQPPSSIFFDPCSPEALADALVQMLSADNPDRISEDAAHAAASERARLFAGEFLAVCQTALRRRM
ncbi:MAG: glycosyltransferase, partial [Armatimonadota bacterium]